jgi:hypothetical protein
MTLTFVPVFGEARRVEAGDELDGFAVACCAYCVDGRPRSRYHLKCEESEEVTG